MQIIPTYEDVIAAARRIEGHAHRTPVMRTSTIERTLGAALFFKCENLQRIGAFKFRGAFNALSRFTDAQRKAGVIAYSSGNHAQAVALSAKLLGISATIVMPTDAPAAKSRPRVATAPTSSPMTAIWRIAMRSDDGSRRRAGRR